MSIINIIQTNIPAVLIGIAGPWVTIGIFTMILGRWLPHRARLAVFTYAFAVLTGLIITVTQNISYMASAAIAGIYAPPVYFLLFSTLAILRNLYTRIMIKKSGPQDLNLDSIPLGILWAGIQGVFGGLVGMIVGALFSFTGLTFLAFRLFPGLILSAFDPAGNFSTGKAGLFFDVGMYGFAFLGLLLGVAVGIRDLTSQWQQTSQERNTTENISFDAETASNS